jgi:alpha-glucosidase
MSDFHLTDISQFRDPPAVWFHHQEIADGTAPDLALARAARDSRDRCRTPMQWSHAANAGFSPEGVQTWLPLNPNYAEGVNVADQQFDPKSMLNFYKRMLRMRKHTPPLLSGSYAPVHESAVDYFAFLRQDQAASQTCLVVLNLSDRPQDLNFTQEGYTARCLFSTHQPENEVVSLGALHVAPFEVFVGQLTS